MRDAYEHCKDKSDEVLSDIAKHCYDETAEAAGVRLHAAFHFITRGLVCGAQMVHRLLRSLLLACLLQASCGWVCGRA
jgi:hypothetical protein